MRELSAAAAEAGPPRGYRVLRALGGGGMGLVWLCERALAPGVTQRAVVKRPRGDDASTRARFDDEVRALAALRHGCVVALLDAGVDAAGPWLAVEHVEGLDGGALVDAVAAAAQRDPAAGLTVAEAAWVVHEAARGLGAAHAAAGGAILHRDVSPQNLLVSTAGEVKVTDFGIARPAERAARTTTGVVVGNLRYIAPEQLEGRETTARTDVYGLGRVLDELLAVLRPGEDAAALRALAAEATQRDPAARPDGADALRRRVRAAAPDWSDGCDRLGERVRALTARSEGVRAAFADLLGVADESPDGPAATATARAAVAPAPPSAPVAARPRPTGALVGAVALLALGGGALAWRRSAAVAPPPAARAALAALPVPAPVTVAAPAPVVVAAPVAAPAEAPRGTARPSPRRAVEAAVVRAEPAPAAATATLRVSSLPFARVSVDGSRPVGTPHAFALPAGEHELRARFEGDGGAREVVRAVTLAAGETRTLGLTPE